MIEINKEQYKISPDNYYHTKHKKNQIILGGSGRKENLHIIHLNKKEGGKTKKWNTFTISRNGTIYQHYDPAYYTDFMCEKEIDKHSISIILENMGMVFYDFETNKYLNWIHEDCEESLVYEKNWRNSRYWERYTKEQHSSVVDLCKYLCNKFKIPLDSLGFNVHHEDTKNFKGIVTRSNYNMDYNDLNPSFDFKWFLNKITT
jgi:hypothetical protein